MFIINPRNEVEVTVVTDGTTTEAVVRLDGVSEPFAKGTAKRRRGDRRNPEVGILLALARAFEDGAGELRKSLADLGYEEVTDAYAYHLRTPAPRGRVGA